MPDIFSGIRIGVAVTLLGTLLAELFASSSGVGFALIRAMELHNVVDIFALRLLIFLFAAAINGSLHFSNVRSIDMGERGGGHIEAHGITKMFPVRREADEVHALGPLDPDIKRGEFFSVVGPSGCGKSTLLDLLAGLASPSDG